MKKLLRKASLRILTPELAMVKGATDPTSDPNQPPVDKDARANIIDVG